MIPPARVHDSVSHADAGSADGEHVPPTASPTNRVGAARWSTPVTVGVVALGACVLLAVRDPNEPGSYGACPFKAVTGLDCPGCGILRGTHALFTGHPARALDHNIFLPLILLVGIIGYVRWFRRSLGHDVAARRTPPWLMVGGAVLVLTFWVVRNLGGPFEYLASPAS